MKIKLTQAGYKNFTGLFGNIRFTDGISEEVADIVGGTFGATLQCEPLVEDAVPVVPAASAVPVVPAVVVPAASAEDAE